MSVIADFDPSFYAFSIFSMLNHLLVGGAITILKNISQLLVNGKDYPIYEMEND